MERSITFTQHSDEEKVRLTRIPAAVLQRRHPICPRLHVRESDSPFSPLTLVHMAHHHPQAVQWDDTGSATLVAEGLSLKDGSRVLAKIAAAHSNGSMCLEREAHMWVPAVVPLSNSLKLHQPWSDGNLVRVDKCNS